MLGAGSPIPRIYPLLVVSFIFFCMAFYMLPMSTWSPGDTVRLCGTEMPWWTFWYRQACFSAFISFFLFRLFSVTFLFFRSRGQRKNEIEKFVREHARTIKNIIQNAIRLVSDSSVTLTYGHISVNRACLSLDWSFNFTMVDRSAAASS